MKPRKPKHERTPWKYFANKKCVLRVYSILRLLVLATLVLQLVDRNYQNAFICVLTLILFLVPSILERKLHMKLPDTLEIVILLFIFAADILGEIQEYYVLVPHWDTVLHTMNGFLFAAIGFSIVNLLNDDKRVSLTLSPFYMAVAAFCFSMTIGVLWEFFEWLSDCLLNLDMQKDTVLHSVSSVMLHPDGRNDPVAYTGIRDVILLLEDGTEVALNVGGYLDIGLQDTMLDLLVNMVGAVVFAPIGYLYVKTKGKGRIARMFIPEVGQPQENERTKKTDT